MKRLAIQRSWCKGCSICVAFCPKDVLALDSEDKVYVKNPEACIFCRMCELRCPDMAIEVREDGEETASCSTPADNARPGA